MAGRIPDDTLQAIRERVSIVEVVSGYVTLKKAGRNYLGLCPFHSEKTPSFTVSEERGLFHCFGCGAGGSVFTFIMRADRVEFREAVEVLARRAGIQLPKDAQAGPSSDQRAELIRLNELSQLYFREALLSAAGIAARRYLEKRGVTAATVERYGLGFCPATGSGLGRALTAKRMPIEKAVQLGLVGRRADGSLYDRLWGRVTFPIRDGSGRLIGFGGRTLGNDHPKYLNSPESPLFHKGQVLYGLYEAREAIRETEQLIIVEGYLDALALVEAGIGYAVASLGTALSAAQLRLARRFAPVVVACFDGDRAGQAAAERAFPVCVEAGVWGLGAFLPEGEDPDSYVRTHGPTATRALLNTAVPLADFFIQRHDPGPHATLPQRAAAAAKVGEVITRLRDPFQFDLLAKKAAQQLGVDEAIFRTLRPAGAAVGAETEAAANDAFRPEEATLLEVMALDRDVASLVAHRGVLERFSSPALAAAGRALLAAWDKDQSAGSAVDQLPVAVAQRVTAALLGEGVYAEGDRLQVARDCIDRVERRARSLQAREVLANLRQAEAVGDDVRSREQLQRHIALQRRNAADR